MAKATRSNNRKSRVQKPDMAPEKLITVEELAALKIVPWDKKPRIEEILGAEQFQSFGMCIRLAYVTMLKTKEELIGVVEEMGDEGIEEFVQNLQTTQERAEGIAEMVSSAEIRIMSAMAALGLRQEAANGHQAK